MENLDVLKLSGGNTPFVDDDPRTFPSSYNDLIDEITNQAVVKYAENVGDGSATQFTVAHNMNTRDVQVQIWQTSSPYAQVDTDIELPNTNEATVLFADAPASDAYRVVVVG